MKALEIDQSAVLLEGMRIWSTAFNRALDANSADSAYMQVKRDPVKECATYADRARAEFMARFGEPIRNAEGEIVGKE